MMTHRKPIDSVLLIGFGGPTEPDQIMPFLARVTEARGIPQARLLEAAHHYEMVGGRSPYTPQTQQLAASVEKWLAAHGQPIPVHVGMRNWHPFLRETISAMSRSGLRHAAGVILAAHRSEVSWDRYKKDVIAATAAAAVDLEVTYVEPWYQAAGFITACASRIEQISGRRRGTWPAELPLIFTAHSIPVKAASESLYVEEIMTSCRAVAGLLGAADWQLAFQSRSGDPRTPWLEPQIVDVLRERGAAGVREIVICAIGFLSDHVEVLYDLDIEAASVARALGINMMRAAGVIDHTDFIEMLSERILAMTRSDTHR